MRLKRLLAGFSLKLVSVFSTCALLHPPFVYVSDFVTLFFLSWQRVGALSLVLIENPDSLDNMMADNLLWYESRELLDESDLRHARNNGEREVVFKLVELNRQKLRGQRGAMMRIFKPNHHGNDDDDQLLIVASDTKSTDLIRNKSAESILSIQHQISKIFARINKIEICLESVRLASRRLNLSTTKITSKYDLSYLWWFQLAKNPTLAKMFWFAWPILVITILNNKLASSTANAS